MPTYFAFLHVINKFIPTIEVYFLLFSNKIICLAQVKKLFEEHKPVFLGVSGFLIIVLIIIIFNCCRRCRRKDKKQQRKPGSTNHALSMSHEEFHLPRWKKSAVQPRQNKQKEIVSGIVSSFYTARFILHLSNNT